MLESIEACQQPDDCTVESEETVRATAECQHDLQTGLSC